MPSSSSYSAAIRVLLGAVFHCAASISVSGQVAVASAWVAQLNVVPPSSRSARRRLLPHRRWAASKLSSTALRPRRCIGSRRTGRRRHRCDGRFHRLAAAEMSAASGGAVEAYYGAESTPPPPPPPQLNRERDDAIPLLDGYRHVDGPIARVLTSPPTFDAAGAFDGRCGGPSTTVVDLSSLRLTGEWWVALRELKSKSADDGGGASMPVATVPSETSGGKTDDDDHDDDDAKASDANRVSSSSSLFLEVEDLVNLAHLCEEAIFHRLQFDVVNAALPQYVRALVEPLTDFVNDGNATDERVGTSDLRGAHAVVGTQVMLGMLESELQRLVVAIPSERRGRGKKTSMVGGGGAPLLKDTIERLSSRDEDRRQLARVLRALLLPKFGGLNLRNLLWHGFLGRIERRWFALSVVLTLTVIDLGCGRGGRGVVDDAAGVNGIESKEESGGIITGEQKRNNPARVERRKSSTGKEEEDSPAPRSLASYPPLHPLIHHGRTLLRDGHPTSIEQLERVVVSSSFLPPSHRPLLHVALTKYSDKPACFAAIISTIVEHSLRLLWCEANDRPADRVARVGSYYVTLDGHGQRDRHDLLLSPYVSVDRGGVSDGGENNGDDVGVGAVAAMARGDEGTMTGRVKNGLVGKLGGDAVSLLTDLFASPCGGPNVRAAAAHGMWDAAMVRELEESRGSCDEEERDGERVGTARAEKETTFIASKMDDPRGLPLLDEVSCLLLATLHLLADRCGGAAEEETNHPLAAAGLVATDSLSFPREAIASFRPSFSYAASLSMDLDDALNNLNGIRRNMEERSGEKVAACGGNNRRQMELHEAMLSIAVPVEELVNARRRILGDALVDEDVDGTSRLPWTDRRLFVEHECNLRAGAACGAARALLSDVAVASRDYLNRIERVAEDSGYNRSGDSGSTRSKRAARSLERLRSVGSIVLLFYSFSIYVALCFIELSASNCNRSYGSEVHGVTMTNSVADQLPLRAVERTRMCLSTFGAFIAINVDRALKSLETYLAGRAVKELIAKRLEYTGHG